MARTSIATDDFNRASLGANWTNINVSNGGNLSIDSSIRITGQYSSFGDDANAAVAMWVGAGSFTNDQYSSLKLTNFISAGQGASYPIGVAVRASGSDASRSYYAAVVKDSASNTTRLFKVVSGALTQLATTTGTTWADNDVITIECEGTAIRVFKNATQITALNSTDSSIASGATGVAGVNALYGDDWDGGNITAAAPVLSAPTATATGPTQATIGLTSDTAPTATAISYQILPAASGAPSAPTIDGAPDGTITTGTAGALTKAITGLTTNTAVKVHFAQGATSNVVSSASFTPNTAASSGSPSAQTGTAGGGITWTGATPNSLLTNTGNGSGSWSIVSSAGFTVAPSINTSTGVLSGGTLSSAGTYAPQVRYTDSSTVPSAQTVTFTLSLTVSGGGGGGDVTPPTMSAASVTGGTLSATGSITSNETGTLWWKMDGSATATDPGAGSEAGAGWSSQSMLAAANSVNFSTQPAGTRYGHFIGIDAAGKRAAVVNASGTVTAGAGTYSAQTDIVAVAGIALANTLVYFTWCPSGRPGAITSPVNGSTTTDSDGRATISHTVAGDGFVLIGTRPGPVVSNDRVFAQFLTLS